LDDASVSAFWNPGFLALEHGIDVGVSRSSLSYNRRVSSAAVSGGASLKPFAVAGALARRRFSWGGFQGADSQGSVGTFELRDTAHFVSVSGAFADAIGVGLSGVWENSEISNTSEEGFSFGCGVGVSPSMPMASGSVVTPLFGASLLNLDGDIPSLRLLRELRVALGARFATQAMPVRSFWDPARLRILDLLVVSEIKCQGERIRDFHLATSELHNGLEISLFKLLSGRVGYEEDLGSGDGGFTYGLGLASSMYSLRAFGSTGA